MDETISDQFISLIRGESVANSANVLGCGGGPHSIGGAGLADDGQLSSPVCINPDIHHCYKSCASKSRERYLPQETLFNIFLRLPAQVLQDVMRHVCREWSLVIRNPNFIHHHLRNSTSGMIIQKVVGLPSIGNGVYLEMRRGSLEIRDFDCGIGGRVWTSCNGLVLARDFRDLRILYVTNPLTKQRAPLPPYFYRIKNQIHFCLAFVEASMEYKVVNARDYVTFHSKPQIKVLTVAVDNAWRHIDIEHLSLKTREAFMSTPLVTGAYVHWRGTTFVLTLNLETETIHRFSLPQLQAGCGKFLPMGSNLSAVYKSSMFSMDVWEMNPETGTWTMTLRFDVRPLLCKFPDLFPKDLNYLIPLGWLEVREVLLFRAKDTQKCCAVYNIKTRKVQSFEVYPLLIYYHFQPHVNSLLWLERGS